MYAWKEKRRQGSSSLLGVVSFMALAYNFKDSWAFKSTDILLNHQGGPLFQMPSQSACQTPHTYTQTHSSSSLSLHDWGVYEAGLGVNLSLYALSLTVIIFSDNYLQELKGYWRMRIMRIASFITFWYSFWATSTNVDFGFCLYIYSCSQKFAYTLQNLQNVDYFTK